MTISHLFKPLSALTDDELMWRVRSRDDDRAYGELYHRHARRLMGFFFRQLGGEEPLAADLTQDAFMRIWTSRDKFTGTNFRTWLFTLSYNLVKNHYRHSGHQRQYEAFVVQTHEAVAESNVIDTLDNEAFDLALKRLLEKLPPESRLLFSLRFEEELAVPQIAEIMAIPEGTVKSRLFALTQSLKQKLNHHDTI